MRKELQSIKEQAKAFRGKKVGDSNDRELLVIIAGMIIKLHEKINKLKLK